MKFHAKTQRREGAAPSSEAAFTLVGSLLRLSKRLRPWRIFSAVEGEAIPIVRILHRAMDVERHL